MSDENKKIQMPIYVEGSFKTEVDDYIYDKRIRSFQDAYRQILKLGFEQFKKTGGIINA